MRINKDYIILLMQQYGWSQSELARRMNVSRATISRIFNDSRGSGKEVIAGLLKAFPNEPIDKLFFLSDVSTNDDKGGVQTSQAS
ncbi:MAG: DNA-binding protein [Clostridia bacterium]|nr:DNA-binding protein [Clostridia bacterium]